MKESFPEQPRNFEGRPEGREERITHRLPDSTLGPDEAVEREELRKLIEKRISRLKGKDYEEVARRLFVEGESIGEVAEALVVTPSYVATVRQKILRQIGMAPAELKPYLPKEK
ncbi:MAG: hypothetical protein ABSE18_01045 [Minisyncoccia bacterium]|jgi:DNA-directed RNA polymerase specialized sigma subunit